MNNDIVHSFFIAEIVVKDGRRKPDPVAVERMAADIQRRGLRVPIEVSKLPDGMWELVTGGHRLAAHKLLGCVEINGFIVKGSADEKDLDQALENLVRSELTKLERAQSVWRVKQIFQLNNPNRKHGGGRKAGEYQNPDSGTWYEAIAVRSGWGKSVLEESAKIGKKIDRQAADLLWGTDVADNQRELLSLVEYGREVQRDIAARISSGMVKTVAAGAAMLNQRTEPEEAPNAAAKEVSRISNLWGKIGDDAKRAFVEVLRKEGFI